MDETSRNQNDGMDQKIDEILNQVRPENVIHSVEIKPSTPVGLQEKLAEAEFRKGREGLVAGVLCIISGMALCYLGIKGTMTWTAKILGSESKMWDASPGAILFIVGVFIIMITNPKFKHK